MGKDQLRSAAASEVDRWERQLGDELTRLFDRQQSVVLVRLQGTKARKHTRHWEPAGERKLDPAYVADAGRWVKDAAGAVAPIVRRIYTAVWTRVTGALGGAAEPDDATLEQAVQGRLEAIAAGVETAVGEVQAFIDSEDKAGTAMPDLVAGVRDLYAQRTSSWVSRITTLSAVGTINHAAMSAAFHAGSVQKQWLSRRDERVRDTHEHADGQVRPILGKFKLGGIATHPATSELLFPGDPAGALDETINCRCTLLFSPARAAAGPRPGGSAAAKAAGLVLAAGAVGAAAVAAGGGGGGGGATVSAAAATAAVAASQGDEEQPPPASKAAEHVETKDRVRTAAGVRTYGQPIGSVIHRDPLLPSFSARPGGSAVAPPAGSGSGSSTPSRPVGGTRIAGHDVEVGGRNADVYRLAAKYSASGTAPDRATSETIVLRDKHGRVGAYVIWATKDGAQPKGTILEVSVHPKLRGQRIGDQLVAAAAKVDPDIKVQSRPPSSTPATPASRSVGNAPSRARPAAAGGPLAGMPSVRSRAVATDAPGTSGDFSADAARIDRLQKAYLRDRVDTESLFSKGGRWTRSREAEQQQVIDHFLNQPGVKKDHQILILGGLPGAGKTTTINSPAGQAALGIDLADYVTVNADEVKEQMVARGMVPDYPGLAPEEAATLFHKESFEIAHALMRQAAKQGKNFAYDTSLKTSGQVGFATSAGSRTMPPPWKTTMLFVDVPLAVAKQRARDRYLAGERYMPLALIDGMRASSKRHSSGPSETFDAVKRQADRWVVVDNSGAAPVVVGTGGKGTRPSRSGGGSRGAAPSSGATPPATSQPAASRSPSFPTASVPTAAAATPAAPAAPAAAPAAALPAGVPSVPAGSRVYANPSGKHIVVLPNGSMEVWKPDGKRGSSSATPAKLAAGHGAWTDITPTLTSGKVQPPTNSPSASSGPSLVPSPKAPVVEQASAPAPAHSRPVVPMDFNEVRTLSEVPKYIADPDFVFQQKVDGIRGVLVVEPGKPPWFASKKGDRLVNSTAAKITGPILAKMPPTPAGSPGYRVEGELLNGKWHVFDMITDGGEKVPYEQRKTMADAWVAAVSPALPQVQTLPTATTAKAKQELWDKVLASGAEGVMMKRRDSPYDGGARVSHSLKAKVTATADAVVLSRNVGGKDNAEFGLRQGGRTISIGNVSTGGKDKALGQIVPGDVVEIEYLWASDGNKLAQPRILRKRPDKTAADATDVSQLRLVDKTVLALAAKAMRLRLEWAQQAMMVS